MQFYSWSFVLVKVSARQPLSLSFSAFTAAHCRRQMKSAVAGESQTATNRSFPIPSQILQDAELDHHSRGGEQAAAARHPAAAGVTLGFCDFVGILVLG